MRIAVIDHERCIPQECNVKCMRVCPKVQTGDETITVGEETKKPVISEELCTGCGICVKLCPFDAIQIINLPEALENPVHQYGENGFRLFNLPVPRQGIVGLVGANGVGKSTALKILSGEIQPNLAKDANWRQVIERFRGHEIQAYLEKLAGGKVNAVYKPQYVDAIPRHVKGKVGNVLKRRDENGRLEEYVQQLDMDSSLDKEVKSLSGGEVQRMALIASLIQEADIYLIDEPSSYLDVRERLKVANLIRSLTDKYVVVVEHDLVVLDYLSDYVHVLFGAPGAYGVVSTIKGVRVGINEYLGGFLRAENMRFRGEIKFDASSVSKKSSSESILAYPALKKKYPKFALEVAADKINRNEVIGILGANATGKTTFMKLLAGVEEPDEGKLDSKLKISYKPQYVKTSLKHVGNLGIKEDLIERFRLRPLLERGLNELSGGELQRVAIADCLNHDADMYLLDEPSAYLDVEERLSLCKHLKRFCAEKDTSVMVIDHDMLIVDYLADRIQVFEGTPGVEGKASEIMEGKKGLNHFLKGMDVTLRRDEETHRPRANKPGSVKDREQRSKGVYYLG